MVRVISPFRLHKIKSWILGYGWHTYTAMHLDIEFRKHTSIEDTCFRNVPDSSNVYNAPNEELNGLALGHAPGAVRVVRGLSPFLAWLFLLLSFSLLSFFIFVAEVIWDLETLLDSRNTSAPADAKPICTVHAQNHANNRLQGRGWSHIPVLTLSNWYIKEKQCIFFREVPK